MTRIADKVDESLKRYLQEHTKPIYVILSSHDAERLFEDAKELAGLSHGQSTTSYKDMKIVNSPALKDGAFYFTNELPETGS